MNEDIDDNALTKAAPSLTPTMTTTTPLTTTTTTTTTNYRNNNNNSSSSFNLPNGSSGSSANQMSNNSSSSFFIDSKETKAKLLLGDNSCGATAEHDSAAYMESSDFNPHQSVVINQDANSNFFATPYQFYQHQHHQQQQQQQQQLQQNHLHQHHAQQQQQQHAALFGQANHNPIKTFKNSSNIRAGLKTWRSDTNLSSNLAYVLDADVDEDAVDRRSQRRPGHHAGSASYHKMNRSDLDEVDDDDEDDQVDEEEEEDFNDDGDEDEANYEDELLHNRINSAAHNNNKLRSAANYGGRLANNLGPAKINGFGAYSSSSAQQSSVINHKATAAAAHKGQQIKPASNNNNNNNNHNNNGSQRALMSHNSNSWENSNGGLAIDDMGEYKMKSLAHNNNNNNDIYKLAKKNYKLTHDRKSQAVGSNYLEDSQTSSALMNQSSSNLDESNYSEIFNEAEPIYTSQHPESMTTSDIHYAASAKTTTTTASKRQTGGGRLETFIPNNLNDSISNWSMKISNCQAPTRSMSRSPLPHSCSSSQYYQNVYGVLASPNEFNRAYFDDEQQQQMQQQKLYFAAQHSKSTTSWGKLKHSKSKLSNRADEIQTSSECESAKLSQAPLQTVPAVPKSLVMRAPTDNSQFYVQHESNHSDDANHGLHNFHHQHQNYLSHENRNIYEQTSSISSASSPSLFKLFQYSKLNSSQINSSMNGADLVQSRSSSHRNNNNNNYYVEESRASRQEQMLRKPSVKKTSFSQMSRRSRSSCALTNPNEYSTEMDDDYRPLATAGFAHQHQQQRIAVDQSIQTSQVVWMAENSVRRRAAETGQQMSKLASLPDLTFLKDYGDENAAFEMPPPMPQQRTPRPVLNELLPNNNYLLNETPAQLRPAAPLQPQNGSPVGSDLLKRKTLKSIKRYRQTKQNTEPCVLNENQTIAMLEANVKGVDLDYLSAVQHKPFSPYADYQVVELKREQPILMPKGFSANQFPVDDRMNERDRDRHHHHHQPPPLKSCLKRNDQERRRQKGSKPAASTKSPLINFDYCAFVKENDTEAMFVPFVGYLFTLDAGSSTRYNYYNNLERYRAIKSYRHILTLCQRDNPRRDAQDELAELDDEDEFENEFNNGGNIKMNKLYHDYQALFARSHSDADVTSAARKSARLVDGTGGRKKARPVSFGKRPRSASLTTQRTRFGSSTQGDDDDASSTTTMTSKSGGGKQMPTSRSESSRISQEATGGDAGAGALLQYDNLIRMLKSNSLGKDLKPTGGQRSAVAVKSAGKSAESPAAPLGFNLIQDLRRSGGGRSKDRSAKSKELTGLQPLPSAKHLDDSVNYIKIAQVIDADSISLASLSESPPSEFKFSDDEERPTDSSTTTTTTRNSAASSGSKRLDVNELSSRMSQETVKQTQAKLSELSANKQRIREKHFHNILLQEPKLNSLKEILSELKQYNSINIPVNHFCSIENLSISHSQSQSTTSSIGHDVKAKIERLALNLFEFLKQGLKPVALLDAMNTSEMAPQLAKPYESSSSTLTTQCTQYTQLWNLIENVINISLASETATSTSSSSGSSFAKQQQQQQTQRRGSFHLPKEVYLGMFQEINRYAKTISQTFLIDSDSASQLRRKHNYMVMLKTLKYKFQLFVLNLLNHKQLARFFKYLKKEKALLNRYYDLKPLSHRSGSKGRKPQTSSDSDSSVESLTTIVESVGTAAGTDDHNVVNKSPSTLASLANVSIFENDDYFDYFYKTLEQFSSIEINVESLKEADSALDQTTTVSSLNSTAGSVDAAVKQFRSHTAQSSVPKFANRFNLAEKGELNGSHHHHHQHQQQHAGGKKTTMNDSKSFNNISSAAANNNNNSNNGFILKNISKRLNIKSWFASSSSSNAAATSSSVVASGAAGQQVNPAVNTQSPPSSISSQSSFAQSSSYTSSSSSTNVAAPPAVSARPHVHRPYTGANTSGIIKLGGGDESGRVLPDLDKSSAPSSKTLVKNKKKGSRGLQIKLRSLSNPMKHSISEPSLNN